LIDGDNQNEIQIIAIYQDNSDWSSPIGIPDLFNWQKVYGSNIVGISTNNGNGSYQGQLTLYRAGIFKLNITVNGQHVKSSPWSPVLVSPTDLYAPSCVPKGIPTTMFAGTQYTFLIQSRDFYSNNMKLNL
jgi:hypothetical protein